MRQHILRHAIGLLILLALLLHSSEIFRLPLIDSLDRRIYDAKVQLTMPETIDERLVILDIDEKSLAEIGRWPWGRDRLATLVDKLFEHYRIRAVGFDVLLSEPDESSGLKVLDELGRGTLAGNLQYLSTINQLRPQLDYDNLLAASLRGRTAVLGFYFADEGRNSGAIPSPVLPGAALQGRDSRVVTKSNYGGALPMFQNAAFSAGHVNPIVDPDGSVRRVPLLVKHAGNYYESLSLSMVRALLGNPAVVPGFDGTERDSSQEYGAVDWLDLPIAEGTLRIPVDANIAALVPYRGREKSYPYYSIADILADRVSPELLQGRVALVGTSAPGLRDQRTTPVGEVYPGVEVHANLVSGILDGTIRHKPQYATAVEFLFLLLAGGMMIFLFPWRSPIRATLATLGMLAAVLVLDLGLWQYANWVQPLAATLLLICGLFMLNMSYGYFVESKTRRQFTELFGQYVPPELVEEMSRNPQSYSMASRRAELTVLFSDVRGFTTMSEGMEAGQLAHLMNEYLGAMTMVIRKHRGTLDKYIGDAIMAFWGAPVNDSDHARNAVVTALEMQKALGELNQTLAARGISAIRIGIGINTGSMTVGDMGSVVRKAYTVMGDAVNLGARLESITKRYGVVIIVGEATRRAVGDVVFRELDLVQVKGKEEPVAIYEPLGMEEHLPSRTLEELERWNQMLGHYRKQAWQEAGTVLDELLQVQPGCPLYELYKERISAFRTQAPDPAWTGITRFDTK